MSTKNTILKAYDGRFLQIFQARMLQAQAMCVLAIMVLGLGPAVHQMRVCVGPGPGKYRGLGVALAWEASVCCAAVFGVGTRASQAAPVPGLQVLWGS